jgi:hypothetical protein
MACFSPAVNQTVEMFAAQHSGLPAGVQWPNRRWGGRKKIFMRLQGSFALRGVRIGCRPTTADSTTCSGNMRRVDHILSPIGIDRNHFIILIFAAAKVLDKGYVGW